LNDCAAITDKFRIMHQNIGGLLNKLDLVQLSLQAFYNNKQDIDVLCFSETFVKLGCENNIKLDNLKLATSYCRKKGRGGTAILVKKSLEVKPIAFLSELASNFFFECCGIEILGLDLIVIVIYRIPENTKSHIGIFIHKLDKLLFQLTTKFNKGK
jgi:exonuclease III